MFWAQGVDAGLGDGLPTQVTRRQSLPGARASLRHYGNGRRADVWAQFLTCFPHFSIDIQKYVFLSSSIQSDFVKLELNIISKKSSLMRPDH